MPRPILVFTLAVAAALLGIVAAATAPFHSPSIAARFQCPPGTTIRVSEYRASWNDPGETGIAVACVDARGAVQQSAESETRGFWILSGIYFLPALALLLLMAWAIASLRRRRAVG